MVVLQLYVEPDTEQLRVGLPATDEKPVRHVPVTVMLLAPARLVCGHCALLSLASAAHTIAEHAVPPYVVAHAPEVWHRRVGVPV